MKHEYITQGGNVTLERWNDGEAKSLEFIYDNGGAPYSVIYTHGGTSDTYYYILNQQGDVVRIVDTNGATVAEYSYNSWGEILNVTKANGNNIGDLNSLRYRSYFYDTESSLYYISSRYYDPRTHRFVNADSQTSAGLSENNLFSYCANNPVNRLDEDGNSWKGIKSWFAKKCKQVTKFAKKTTKKIVAIVKKNGKRVAKKAQKIKRYFSIPSKSEHYKRNNNNPVFPNKYDKRYFNGWDSTVAANCHQFSSPDHSNKKYVSPDGKYEAIYDKSGNLVTDIRDVGTYNFVSPLDDPVGHMIKDIVPWVMYGNAPNDSTEWFDRVSAMIGIYT